MYSIQLLYDNYIHVAMQAFSFLSVILFGCLAVWSIMFLRNEWNKAVIKYTLKHAITG